MNNIKKIISIILIATISFCGCQQTNKPTSSQTDITETTTEISEITEISEVINENCNNCTCCNISENSETEKSETKEKLCANCTGEDDCKCCCCKSTPDNPCKHIREKEKFENCCDDSDNCYDNCCDNSDDSEHEHEHNESNDDCCGDDFDAHHQTELEFYGGEFLEGQKVGTIVLKDNRIICKQLFEIIKDFKASFRTEFIEKGNFVGYSYISNNNKIIEIMYIENTQDDYTTGWFIDLNYTEDIPTSDWININPIAFNLRAAPETFTEPYDKDVFHYNIAYGKDFYENVYTEWQKIAKTENRDIREIITEKFKEKFNEHLNENQ